MMFQVHYSCINLTVYRNCSCNMQFHNCYKRSHNKCYSGNLNFNSRCVLSGKCFSLDQWSKVNVTLIGNVLRVNGQFPLQWRHNGWDNVSSHQPFGCLLNRLFGRRSKKTSKLRVTGLCAGNSPGPVNSPHKGPVTRKMFPFDDVIMHSNLVTVL